MKPFCTCFFKITRLLLFLIMLLFRATVQLNQTHWSNWIKSFLTLYRSYFRENKFLRLSDSTSHFCSSYFFLLQETFLPQSMQSPQTEIDALIIETPPEWGDKSLFCHRIQSTAALTRQIFHKAWYCITKVLTDFVLFQILSNWNQQNLILV